MCLIYFLIIYIIILDTFITDTFSFIEGGSKMPDIKYELLEEYGVFSENNKGWTREVNLMSWNNGTPKYDIRDWAPDHEKMGKGITLSKEEFQALKELINKIED